MDISHTLAPKSDQLDAVELIAPRTFIIESVSAGNDEQPINIKLAGFPRPWRPGVSMRRVLASLWTVDSSAWVGKAVTLYNDTRVKFGNDPTGGTRISHMSDIGDKKRSVPLLVSKGRSALYTVEPMSRADALRAEWPVADPERRKAIEAEMGVAKDATPVPEIVEAEIVDAADDPTLDPAWGQSDA